MSRRTWWAILASALLASGMGGCAAAGSGGNASTSPYFPFTDDPNLIEPPWHRYLLAYELTQKCGFGEAQVKLKLALAAAQEGARTPRTPEDSAPNADLTAINNTPPQKLCNAAMKGFVEAQAAAAP